MAGEIAGDVPLMIITHQTFDHITRFVVGAFAQPLLAYDIKPGSTSDTLMGPPISNAESLPRKSFPVLSITICFDFLPRNSSAFPLNYRCSLPYLFFEPAGPACGT